MNARVSISFAGLTLALAAGCSGGKPSAYQGYVEGEYVHVASPINPALIRFNVK